MGKKNTAHRPSEPDKKFVTAGDGRKVRNTAYRPRTRHRSRETRDLVFPQGAFTKDTLRVKKDGTVEFRDSNGALHRDAGPAVFNPDLGHEEYYRHGTLHRVGGPAIVSQRGEAEEWFVDGVRHNSTGPAVKNPDETRWYSSGELHRKDGPAVEKANGEREYWVNGELRYSDNATDPPPDEPLEDTPPDNE